MAIDAPTLIAEYPEFGPAYTAQPAMVERALRLALSQTDAAVYGSAHQDAVFLLAAHNLAYSPFGENLRLKDGSSIYLEQYKRLRDTRRPRVMVAGGLGTGNGY